MTDYRTDRPVTQEMRNAGERELLRFERGYDHPGLAAERIYRAMAESAATSGASSSVSSAGSSASDGASAGNSASVEERRQDLALADDLPSIVTPQMIDAGLAALDQSGITEHELSCDKFVVVAIFKAMLDAATHLDQQRIGPNLEPTV